MEQVPELSESPEQKPTKSGKVNLRKSLAWDNAFFTSEGVLNAEELAIVNSTFRKTEMHSLPGIPEDMWKSTESACTLDNDNWELESLEVDVFENLRASIQQSIGKCEKASNLVLSKKPTEQGDQNTSLIGPSKNVGISSQNKMKLPNTSRRHAVTKQRPEDTKEALSHVKVDASGIGVSKPSLKPPRMASRATTLPTMPVKKSSASGSIQTKNNTHKILSGNAANRQTVIALKRSGESHNGIPRSIPSPKAISGASGSLHKSSLEDSRKQIAKSINRSSSESTTKTLLRASKSKIGQPNKLDNPSMFKPSSIASPSSSFDSMVSASSSSSNSAALMKHSYSTESLDASDSCELSTVQPSHGTGLSASLPCSPLSTGEHSRSFINSSTGADCFKPSGLRMPTPKIGYFDAEKSLVRSSRKFSQSGLQNNPPKNNTGTSNTAGANKLRPNKPPSVRLAAQGEIVKSSDSSHTRTTRLSSIYASKASPPSSLHRLSKPAELCGTPRNAKDHEMPSRVNKDLSPITKEEGHMENESRSGLRASQKENVLSSDNTGSLVEFVGQKVSSLSLSEANACDGGESVDLGPSTRTPLADKSPQIFDS